MSFNMIVIKVISQHGTQVDIHTLLEPAVLVGEPEVERLVLEP